MATWTGSIGPGTDVSTGRSIYLDWTIDSSDPVLGSTSVDWRLRIWVRTGGQSIDSNNSFTISGSWTRSGSVSINTPSGGGSQQIYDSGWGSDINLGPGSVSSRAFTASLSGVTVVTGRDYPAISGSSGTKSVTVPALPSAPTNVSSTPQNGYLSVSFSAPSSSGTASVTSYQYSLSSDSTWRDAGTSGSFNTISLSNGTSYTVYVRAVSSVGAGPSASTTNTPRTVPGPVASFTANNSTVGQLVLSWTAPTDNGGSAITGYTLKRGGTELLNNANQLTYTDTGLTPASSYLYEISAVNAAGTGSGFSKTFDTLGGVVNIRKTGGYDKVVPKVRVNGVWVQAQARIRDNNQWKYGI